jgi:hypothetical protein
VVGFVNGSVVIDTRAAKKLTTKKFSIVSKCAKAVAYSRAKLTPRLTDLRGASRRRRLCRMTKAASFPLCMTLRLSLLSRSGLPCADGGLHA